MTTLLRTFPTLRTYGGAWLIAAAFAVVAGLKLLGVYLPTLPPVAARTDFSTLQTAVAAYKQGLNPYDLATFRRVYAEQVAPGLNMPPFGEIAASYLYPPFSVLALSGWMGPDILANARLFTVMQVLGQIVLVGLTVLLCARLRVAASVAVTATAALCLFLLDGGPAQEGLRLGQISGLIGLVVLGAAYAAVAERRYLSYALVALGASLKIVPVVLLGAIRLRWVAALVGFGAVVLALNLLDVDLFKLFLTTDVVPPRVWLEYAYSLGNNHALPAMTYRLLGTETPGKLAGYALIAAGMALAAVWQWRNRAGHSTAGPAPQTFLPLASLLVLSASLGAGIFWEHHLCMYAPLLLATEAALAPAQDRPVGWGHLLGWVGLGLLLYNPSLTIGSAASLPSKVLGNLFTVAALGLWGRYAAVVWGSLRERMA